MKTKTSRGPSGHTFVTITDGRGQIELNAFGVSRNINVPLTIVGGLNRVVGLEGMPLLAVGRAARKAQSFQQLYVRLCMGAMQH